MPAFSNNLLFAPFGRYSGVPRNPVPLSMLRCNRDISAFFHDDGLARESNLFASGPAKTKTQTANIERLLNLPATAPRKNANATPNGTADRQGNCTKCSSGASSHKGRLKRNIINKDIAPSASKSQ